MIKTGKLLKKKVIESLQMLYLTEETKEAELKKSKNIDQEEDLEEEAQVHDEPKRPLKRLLLRHQEGHVSPSLGNSIPGWLELHPESLKWTGLKYLKFVPNPFRLSLAIQECSDPSEPCATDICEFSRCQNSPSVPLVCSASFHKRQGTLGDDHLVVPMWNCVRASFGSGRYQGFLASLKLS